MGKIESSPSSSNFHRKAAGIVEVSNISQGYELLDKILKSGKSLELIEGSYISPGKFIIFFAGLVEEVNEALQLSVSFKDALIDWILIPKLSSEILRSMYGLTSAQATPEGLLVLESSSLSSGVGCAHTLLDMYKLIPLEIRTGRGIGGKCLLIFSGTPEELFNSQVFSEQFLRARGSYISSALIHSPHKDFLSHFRLEGKSS